MDGLWATWFIILASAWWRWQWMSNDLWSPNNYLLTAKYATLRLPGRHCRKPPADAVRSKFLGLQTLCCITMSFVTSSSLPMMFPPNITLLGRACRWRLIVSHMYVPNVCFIQIYWRYVHIYCEEKIAQTDVCFPIPRSMFPEREFSTGNLENEAVKGRNF